MTGTAARKDSSRALNPVDAHIGRRLRLRRIMVGLSQEELAAEVGVAFQQIQKYECAVNRISSSRLWAMAGALKCPVSFFYEAMDPAGATAGGGRDRPAPMPAPPASESHELSARPETLKLVRAYYTIKNGNTRRQIFELAALLSKASARSAPRHEPGNADI